MEESLKTSFLYPKNLISVAGADPTAAEILAQIRGVIKENGGFIKLTTSDDKKTSIKPATEARDKNSPYSFQLISLLFLKTQNLFQK